MGKTLKMAFAMGGGVSLGSFSGAGLAEAIKQAVLNGGYVDGDEFKRYDDVVVDVFSGASAGSMSLAIMLRGLAHQTDEELAQAQKDLADEGIVMDGWSEQRKKALIAAQVVKNLQLKIWTEEININTLLGKDDAQKAALAFEAGLVRRGALESIANRYFQLDGAFSGDFGRRSILADEVLFASTLASLTGIVYSSQEGTHTNPNYIGTHDSNTSRCHKELRVFHLMFNKAVDKAEVDSNPDKYPARWIRYHSGGREAGVAGDLKNRNAWSRMVTTSMACGAFPFAFEPVALERFQFEYGKECWPAELTPEVCTLAMESETPQTEDALSFPFSYVDGGTFNNEPVREAFRLAAFQDAEDTGDFERVVIFVDPSIGDEHNHFTLPYLKQYAVQAPRSIAPGLDDYDLVRLGSLDRLLPHVGSLVTMLTDEGSVNEGNKIAHISKLFTRQEDYHKVVESLVNSQTNIDEAIDTVLKPILQILNTRKQHDTIPSGALTLRGELIRVCKLAGSEFNTLFAYKEHFRNRETLKQITDAGHGQLLLKALLRIFLDQLMDLSGKNPDYKIIAIAPQELKDGVYRDIDLPGSPLFAFSGFASRQANVHAAELAAYTARDLMQKLGMLPADLAIGEKPVWDDAEKAAFKIAFDHMIGDLKGRIDSLFDHSHLVNVFWGLDTLALNALKRILHSYLDRLKEEKVKSTAFRFMIEVTDEKLELAGNRNKNDFGPVTIEKKRFLITEQSYFAPVEKAGYWEGIHIQNGQFEIMRDGLSILPDRAFCTIALPTEKQIYLAGLMPNPTFSYRPLTAADKGQHLGAEGWQVKPGIRLPERTLLDQPLKVPPLAHVDPSVLPAVPQ